MRSYRAFPLVGPTRRSLCPSTSLRYNSLLDKVLQAVCGSWFKCWVWACLHCGQGKHLVTMSCKSSLTMPQKGSEGKAIQSEGETGRGTTAAQRLRPEWLMCCST